MRNVGSIDRIVVGLVLIAYAIAIDFHQTGWNWIGVVPLLTAVFAYCPAHTLFVMSTHSAQQQS